MAQKIATGMPDTLDLTSAWTIQFAAVDPTTGAAVSGVTFSNAAIIAAQVEGSVEDLAVAPLWVPIPISDLNTVAGS